MTLLSNYTGMTHKLSYYTVQLQAKRVDCPISAQAVDNQSRSRILL